MQTHPRLYGSLLSVPFYGQQWFQNVKGVAEQNEMDVVFRESDEMPMYNVMRAERERRFMFLRNRRLAHKIYAYYTGFSLRQETKSNQNRIVALMLKIGYAVLDRRYRLVAIYRRRLLDFMERVVEQHNPRTVLVVRDFNESACAKLITTY